VKVKVKVSIYGMNAEREFALSYEGIRTLAALRPHHADRSHLLPIFLYGCLENFILRVFPNSTFQKGSNHDGYVFVCALFVLIQSVIEMNQSNCPIGPNRQVLSSLRRCASAAIVAKNNAGFSGERSFVVGRTGQTEGHSLV
jgi:hypothetical protein